MKTSQRGLNMIKGFEGFEFTAYKCPAGVWTIGHGHTKGVKGGDIITRPQAEAFLMDDLREAEDAVNKLVDVPLNQNQFDSLVSFTFNVGVPPFRESTMLKMLNRRLYRQATAEFDRWVHGGPDKNVIAGLANRRRTEKNLFKSDKVPLQDKVLLVIGDNFMQARHTVEVDLSDMEREVPFNGYTMIFRDKGNRHKMFNYRLFELDEIK